MQKENIFEECANSPGSRIECMATISEAKRQVRKLNGHSWERC